MGQINCKLYLWEDVISCPSVPIPAPQAGFFLYGAHGFVFRVLCRVFPDQRMAALIRSVWRSGFFLEHHGLQKAIPADVGDDPFCY